jgi:hypothetical protein
VTLETSTDGNTRTTYTIGDTITLSNIWDRVYWRNTSTTDTWFNTGSSNYYNFVMTWSIDASGDVTSLINKWLTDTIPSTYCFYRLFYWCSALRTPPKIIATTLKQYCYRQMFCLCTNLEVLPKLPATTLMASCYQQMFYQCSKIKLSTPQTWEYQTPYRIPSEWTWTTASNALSDMFQYTWWTFTWTPTIYTTYYTSNTVI